MIHQPAPDRHDIELALTRRKPAPALTLRPLNVQPAPVATAPRYTPVERATIRQRWLAHFAALVEYGALWAIILLSLVTLIVV